MPTTTTQPSEFGLVVMPTAGETRKLDVVVVSSVALSFISFWRAAAIVLNDMASTVYYIGGVSEEANGKAAPRVGVGGGVFSPPGGRGVRQKRHTFYPRGGAPRGGGRGGGGAAR